MSETTEKAIAVATGSTDTPVQDGLTRALCATALQAVLLVGGQRAGLSDSEVVALVPVTTALSYIGFGLWDWGIRSRLLKSEK